MSNLSRRDFVRKTGLGMATASLARMRAWRQAPAQFKRTSFRILQWSHFVPAYDVWFDKFTKEWGDKNGVRVRVDRIPHLELPARIAAEFAAGAGHDMILGAFHHGGGEPADVAAREQRAARRHRKGGPGYAGNRQQFLGAPVHHAEPGRHGLILGIEQKYRGEHEVVRHGTDRGEAGRE